MKEIGIFIKIIFAIIKMSIFNFLYDKGVIKHTLKNSEKRRDNKHYFNGIKSYLEKIVLISAVSGIIDPEDIEDEEARISSDMQNVKTGLTHSDYGFNMATDDEIRARYKEGYYSREGAKGGAFSSSLNAGMYDPQILETFLSGEIPKGMSIRNPDEERKNIKEVLEFYKNYESKHDINQISDEAHELIKDAFGQLLDNEYDFMFGKNSDYDEKESQKRKDEMIRPINEVLKEKLDELMNNNKEKK